MTRRRYASEKRDFWTAEDFERLTAAIKAGCTIREAGAKVGRSHCAARYALRRLRSEGGTVRPKQPTLAASWTDADEAIARDMRSRGATLEKIATRLGRSITSVHDRLDRAPPTITIPPHVLADRDRRLSMQPRSLTAALMGDPIEARHGR